MPCVNVWRDYSEGYTPACYIIDFWEEDSDQALEQWHKAEHDAACDELFNPPQEPPRADK